MVAHQLLTASIASLLPTLSDERNHTHWDGLGLALLLRVMPAAWGGSPVTSACIQ